MIDVLLVCLHMQVKFLREKFSSFDIKVDGGLSSSTIDTAAQVWKGGVSGWMGVAFGPSHIQE